MVYEELAVGAMARMIEWTQDFPQTRMTMYRRAAQRQQQLFSMASKVNPDYYGVCAVGGFDANGRLDMRDLINMANLDQAAGIQYVEVNDPGTNPVRVAGEEVHIVSIADQDAELPPRVTVRDFIIRPVSTDLDDIGTIRVWYPRIPDMVGFDEDGQTGLDLLEQHQELLIIDLTKWLLRQTISLDAQVKTQLATLLEEEEKEALADYLADIQAFTVGQKHRFSEPPPTVTR